MRKGILIGTVLGLLFAGTSAAASRWLITSTHQIKPSVLHQLHGARGKTGVAGAPGHFSTANVSVVQGAPVFLCPAGQAQACNVGSGFASCPQGAVALSGGWAPAGNGLVNTTIVDSHPDDGAGSQWFVLMDNESAIAESFTPYAVCAK